MPILIILLLFCAELSAQVSPPARPERPERPTNPATERQVERQLDRALSQVERATERNHTAASRGLAIAEQQLKAAAERVQIASERPAHLTNEAYLSEIELALYQNLPAIKSEWLLLLTNNELAQAQAHSAQWQQYITDQQALSLLDTQILTLRLPSHLDNLNALASLLPADLITKASRNFLFQAQTTKQPELAAETWRFKQPLCQDAMKIGLVDSAIQNSHPAFDGKAAITQRPFHDGRFSADMQHATAIASILIGRSPQHEPLVPNAQLYSANVFFNSANLQAQSTLLSLVQGLNWLAEERVSVINMSLSGPDNPILQQAVLALDRANIVMVAAVGNDGPGAPIRYPAAYPEVIAVTAIDKTYQLYRWAVRGEHIDFAAPGVNLFAASANGGWQAVTGTSFASPIVAGFVACLNNTAGLSMPAIKAALRMQALNHKVQRSEYPLLIPASEG